MIKNILCTATVAFSLTTTTIMAADSENTKIDYTVDKFADIEILRYNVPDFEKLTPKQRVYIYYLSEAAQHGRDILFDQNGKYNLAIRRTLEAVYNNYNGDRDSEDFKMFERYLKQVWFANGVHHHYSMAKFKPQFSQQFFKDIVMAAPQSQLPIKGSVEELLETISPIIFDSSVNPKRVNLAHEDDLVLTSANNYYDGVNQHEAEEFYNAMRDTSDKQPISYGLNSRLVKRDGKIYEEVNKVGGRYSAAIENIVYWLNKAKDVAENDAQTSLIAKLIEYYQTGNLRTFDEYSIEWVEELKGEVDFICAFTEVYGDALGIKASWEGLVNFKNHKASERTETISKNAQWFEDNSPIDPRFRKERVKGVSAKVISVAIITGDCYPATPIGINLPNADWIRRDHGSKSVTIENITESYSLAAKGNGFKEEFVIDSEMLELIEKYGFITGNLHTDLHECLGHGSGKMLEGVDSEALKSFASTLEEARADLFALYYIADPKLLELGLLDNKDAYKAEYYNYMMNGLMTQLMRIEPNDDIEESHMRNRQLIAKWVKEKGEEDKVVEIVKVDGKSYVKINDYQKLRNLFGELLAEIQRIKSEGDYEAGKNIVEDYAVKVDKDIHKEVLERYKSLDIAPYKGFVNPQYSVVMGADGEIVDVTVSYNEDYVNQMLRYSKDYSTLPTYND